MATEAQIAANRLNAQKSTGPRTPEGKEKVSQNAVKHGLLARAAVLHGEDWEEYVCFREDMYEEIYPDGVQEMELAERIISLSWRLGRAGRYLNAVFEALYDKYAAEATATTLAADSVPSIPSDPVLGRMLLADFSGDRVLERILLYERRIESSLNRARIELRQLRRERVASAKRGKGSYDGTWEDSGGSRHASPFARGDFAHEPEGSADAGSRHGADEDAAALDQLVRDPVGGGLYREQCLPRATNAGQEPPGETASNSEEASRMKCQVSSEQSPPPAVIASIHNPEPDPALSDKAKGESPALQRHSSLNKQSQWGPHGGHCGAD